MPKVSLVRAQWDASTIQRVENDGSLDARFLHPSIRSEKAVSAIAEHRLLWFRHSPPKRPEEDWILNC
jgi:hypothetical protein